MTTSDKDDRLFTALAEQLKTPLLQIARLSETPAEATLPHISIISEQALRLVDAYVQVQLQSQTKLLLEPVNTSAVLYDVANTLAPFAKQLDYEIRIDSQGRSVPSMTHGDSLKTMLTLLAAGLIESGHREEDANKYLILGTHRSAKGTVVGVFSSHLALPQKAIGLLRQLHGRANQVVPSLGAAGGAGLAIADKLSGQLSAPIRVYRHNSLMGVGSLLMSSKQLQLIT